MKKLTKMQQKVYDYIAQFMTKWGYPPSVREICAELNFKSPSTAHFHILNLEKKGYLEHDAGKGRAIGRFISDLFVGGPLAGDFRVG